MSVADRALARLLRLPPARNRYTSELGIQIPMRDGVALRADHYAPMTATPRGTVLVRTPYGRGFPESALHGRMLAARGYHVVIGSVRGTFGSDGTFTPMAQETTDGQDTIGWLRRQQWFDGRLATLGASYLGWAQWTLLQDPPPELRTAMIYVGPHDFREAVFGTGAFTLGDFLHWSSQIAGQEAGGLRRIGAMLTARRRLHPGLHGLPVAEAAEPVLRGRAPWYREWISHPEGGDPFWEPYRAGSALDRVQVPVLLVSGWQDLFLGQTLEQYETLRARGAEVSLTVGPWTHVGVATVGAALVESRGLAWLDKHLAAGGPAAPPRRSRPGAGRSPTPPAPDEAPVRVFRTGEKAWHEMTSWPPATTPAPFALRPAPPAESRAASAGSLVPGAPETGPADGAEVTFRYDPADPTPSVGGRVLAGAAGVRDNRPLEARPDVLTFTSAPLAADLDVAGTPVVELALAVDNPYADVFLRLCDVDRRGRSHNFSDRLHRLDPDVPAGQVQRLRLTLDGCFHRLAAGHRLRLQVSGGAHPRYARNLGTDGTLVDGAKLAPTVHTVRCAESRIVLPVTPSAAASTTR